MENLDKLIERYGANNVVQMDKNTYEGVYKEHHITITIHDNRSRPLVRYRAEVFVDGSELHPIANPASTIEGALAGIHWPHS